MFSSFSSGKLSDVTGWLQDKSKEATAAVQKSVNDISAGVTEMVVTPTSQAEPTTQDNNEQKPEAGESANKNAVLNEVTAKFATGRVFEILRLKRITKNIIFVKVPKTLNKT